MNRFIYTIVIFFLSSKLLAAGCDPIYIEEYKMKSACVLENDSTSCTFAAVNAGILGAGGGWLSSLMIEKPSDGQDLKKFRRFINAISTFRTKEYGEIKNALQLKYDSFKTALSEISPTTNTTDYWKLDRPVQDKVMARTRELLSKKIDMPYVKLILEDSKYINEIPNKAFDHYNAKLKTTIGNFYGDELNQLLAIEAKHKINYQDVQETIRLRTEAMEKTNNPKLLSLFNRIIGWTVAEQDAFYNQWRGENRPWIDSKSRSPLSKSISDVKANLKTNLVVTKKVGATLMSGVGLTVADLGMSENQLRKCKANLNLQDKDISFLRTRIVSSLNGSCEDLKLRSIDSIDEAIAGNSGELSEGICNIVRQQDKALDKYIGSDATTKNLSCTSAEIQTSTFQGKLSGSTFEFVDLKNGDKTTATLIDYLNYPDFNRASIQSNGTPSKGKTDKLRTTYASTHYPGTFRNGPTTEQEIDVDNSCKENSVLNCDMIKAATQLMQARSLQKAVCSPENIKDSKNSTFFRGAH